MASYKAKIARLNALLDAQAQVIQEYAAQAAELESRNALQVWVWHEVEAFALRHPLYGRSVYGTALELMKRGVGAQEHPQ